MNNTNIHGQHAIIRRHSMNPKPPPPPTRRNSSITNGPQQGPLSDRVRVRCTTPGKKQRVLNCNCCCCAIVAFRLQLFRFNRNCGVSTAVVSFQPQFLRFHCSCYVSTAVFTFQSQLLRFNCKFLFICNCQDLFY